MIFGVCSFIHGGSISQGAREQLDTRNIRLCSILKLLIVAIGHYFVSSKNLFLEMTVTGVLSSAVLFTPPCVFTSNCAFRRYLYSVLCADSLYILYHNIVLGKNWSLVTGSTGSSLRMLIFLYMITTGQIGCNIWLLRQ